MSQGDPINAPPPDIRSATTQAHILNLLGLLWLDMDHAHLMFTKLLVRALHDVPLSENLVRVTLHRMVQRGLLASARQGRNVAFTPTKAGWALLKRGRDRITSPNPFGHSGDGWTLLNMATSGAEADRYLIQARLSWAGFGMIEPRLWIAPGRVDLGELLRDVMSGKALNALNIFHATIALPTQMERLIANTWNVPAIAAEHASFLGAWENRQPETPALPMLLRLLQGWTHLLIGDPGLPADVLGPQWQAERSTATFRRLYDALLQPARREFDEMAAQV